MFFSATKDGSDLFCKIGLNRRVLKKMIILGQKNKPDSNIFKGE